MTIGAGFEVYWLPYFGFIPSQALVYLRCDSWLLPAFNLPVLSPFRGYSSHYGEQLSHLSCCIIYSIYTPFYIFALSYPRKTGLN
jgi:hypothetical protein